MPKMIVDTSVLEGVKDLCEKLNKNYETYIKKSVFEGTTVIADTYKQNLQNLNAKHFRWQFSNPHSKQELWRQGELSELQKQGLIDSMNISRMIHENGEISQIVSFYGYNKVKTKQYPNGQPNILVMRSLEIGTSATAPQPIANKTRNSTRKKAVQKAQEVIDSAVEEYKKG